MSEKENMLEVARGRRAEAPVGQTQHCSKQPKRDIRAFVGRSRGVPGNAPRARGYGREGGRPEQRRGNREGVRDEKPLSSGSPRQPGTGEGKRKPTPVSLNHLLNFTVERSTDNTSPFYTPRRRRSKVTHTYNKEQFLQANCQFVVASNGEYTIHSQDPDRLVDWQKIEQLRLFCHEIPSCPICLYPPRGAKIARCGHVFCWSCVLHYLSLGEKKWRKCPICYESIYRSDLKSVVALSSPRYRVGDTIAMTLMIREKGCTQVVPRSQWAGNQGLPSLEDVPINRYVKLLSATPAQVLELITGPERCQLISQLETLGSDEASERCFIESALEELEVRETALRQSSGIAKEVAQAIQDLQVASAGVTDPIHTPKPTGFGVWMALADGYFEPELEKAFSDSEEGEGVWSGSSESQDGSPQALGPATPPAEEQVLALSGSPELPVVGGYHSLSAGELTYFYQASDGQHLYLHPVSAKCLAKEYGGLEHCPDTVTARVLEMERLSFQEETRSRYRHLSHLPLTCELVLCELDLRPPTVSRETLKLFSDDLQRRQQKRQRKKREERRRERRVSPPSVPILGPSGITAERLHDLLTLTGSPPLSTPSPPRDAGKGSEVNGTVPTSSPSFAQALRGRPHGVWPTAKSPSVQPVVAQGAEETYTAPSFHDAFNEALGSPHTTDPDGKPGSKTARKGRKKLVLFSTGGARGTS